MTIAKITGIGVWLPPQVRLNDEWPQGFGQRGGGERTFNDIAAPKDQRAAAIVAADLAKEDRDPFLGALRRHVADDATTSDDAETYAATAALADAGVEGKDINLVLANSVVPERIGAYGGLTTSHRIGAKDAQAVGVETACAASVTQLEIARAYIQAGMAKHVLCVQTHLLLRTVAMAHPASPGLGDGASAFVVSAEGKGLMVRSTYAVSHGEEAVTVAWVREPGAGDETPDPSWWLPGARYRLGTKAIDRVKSLMRDTVAYGSETIRVAASRASIDASDIDVIASVQPRGFIPHAIAHADRASIVSFCTASTSFRASITTNPLRAAARSRKPCRTMAW
jgi:3-oxoacyl-[acyl-carrier-protein] synthase III